MERDKPNSGASGGILNRIRMKFGEVAKQLGLVNSSEVKDALVKQASDNSQKRIGEVLVDDRKITESHVEKVLRVQKEWELGAPAPSVKQVEQDSSKAQTSKPAKAATKKPAKKTVRKKTVKAAAKKPAKKTVKKKTATKKTAKAATKKPAKKTVRKKAAKPTT